MSYYWREAWDRAEVINSGVVFYRFFHSQSDVARDDYVRINFDNILPGKESNFIAYTNSYVSDFGQGYDYESILHYGAFAFTKNGGRTIEPKVS